MKSETVFFWTTGEDLTRTIRDLWDSNLVHSAIAVCKDGGLETEDAVKLCTGKLKLEGDTREGDHTLSVAKDDTATDFPIEKQIEQLEDKFVYYTDYVSFLKRQMELGKLPTARASMYRKNAAGNSQYQHDEEMLKDVTKKARETLSALSLIYPVVGKSLLDVPYDKIGQKFSSIESEECGRAWAIVEENVARRRYKEDDEIDKILGEDKPKIVWEAKPDNVNFHTFHHGWISPNGDFYGCRYAEHNQLAQNLEDAKIISESSDSSRWMEENNWMKLQDQKFVMLNGSRMTSIAIPNQKQINMILDYCDAVHNGKIFYNFSEYNTEEFLDLIEEEKGSL
jgi:hypothetical protein